MNSSQDNQFTLAFTKYAHAIVRHIYFRVNNWDVAEDLLQETFYKTWRKAIDDNENIGDLKKYLFKVANNLIIDYYRQKKKQPLSLEEVSEGLLLKFPELEVGLDHESRIGLVKKYIANIKYSYREILTYYLLESLSISEISRITGRSPNNVSVTIHRGLKMIRRDLNQSFIVK